MRSAQVALVVAALGLVASCTGDGITLQLRVEQVMLLPASASLLPGGTQQFSSSARMNDGSVGPVSVTYSATGGTITAGGLYTAGSVAGTYRVIASLTVGTLADSSDVTITATPDYSLALAPATLPVVPGGNASSTVTITRTNFTGAVTLSLGNTPPGVTGSFAPAATTGTTSTLTVSVSAPVAPGTYNLSVDGTGAPGQRATPLTLTVTAAPDYSLALTPAALTIVQGGSDQAAVTITRANFTGAVTLSLGNEPSGVTGSFAPPATTGTTATLTVSVAAAVAPGTYNLTVDGSGTPGPRSTPLTLTVTATPNYALAIAPAALTIQQGASDNATVTITRTNFTGAVTLSLGNEPAGVTGAFVPPAPTGMSSTLTLSVAAAVAPGTYNLTVDGSGTPGPRSTPLTLTVTATPDYALAVAPTALTIEQGASDNASVTITRTNFTGAVTLSLGNEPAGVTGAFVPPAPTGSGSALTVGVGAAVTTGTYNLTVDGSGSPGNRSTPLTLTVTAPVARSYTTTFPLNENPISEGGLWLQTDVTNTKVQTVGGNAFGTQADGPYSPYDDSHTYMTGFGNDYEIEGIVYLASPSLPNEPNHEIELLLRYTDDNPVRSTPYGDTHANGYEINIHHNGGYLNLGRWKGDALVSLYGPVVPATGDRFKARIVGQTISVYWNETLLFTHTDNDPTWKITTGHPGFGFFINPGGGNTNFGFSSIRIQAL
jgi:hypothetical protein